MCIHLRMYTYTHVNVNSMTNVSDEAVLTAEIPNGAVKAPTVTRREVPAC